MKTQKMGYIQWILAAIVMIAVIFGLITFFAQNKRMKEREAEKAELLQKQEELELEKNRLELLTQYIGTEEYAEYYARYRLGYVSADEIMFEK